MSGLYEVFGYGFVLCAILALASLVKPGIGLLPGKKTRLRSCLSWAVLAIVCVAGFGAAMTDADKAQLAAESAQRAERQAREEAEAAARARADAEARAQAEVAAREKAEAEAKARADAQAREAEAAQKEQLQQLPSIMQELSALFHELQEIRTSPEFATMGFARGNARAAAWKDKVEEMRDRLHVMGHLPLEVKLTPATLLQLGMDWMRHPEGTDYSRQTEQSLKKRLK